MVTLYTLAKFTHIAAVIVWLGGVATLSFLTYRLGRQRNPPALAALADEAGVFSRFVVGPAAALTLLAGIVTTTRAGFDFGTLWITWGFAAILLSLVLGASLMRVTTGKLRALATTPQVDDSRLGALQRRLALLNLVNLLLLLSAVWVMVVKPTL